MPPSTRSQTIKNRPHTPYKTKTSPAFKTPSSKSPYREKISTLSPQTKIISALSKLVKVTSLSDKTLKNKSATTLKNKTSKLKTRFRWKTLVSQLREHTLKILCSDAGVCLAFGKLTDQIKKNFEGFANFRYAISPAIRIGKSSSNGFITQIKYLRNEYTSYAVLKSSAKANSDNLMYEYVVGQFINKLNKTFPCFLETYGLYKYNNDSVWKKVRDNKTNTISVISEGLTPIADVDYNVACESSKYIAILIQYLNGVQPLDECMKDADFLENELLLALFQIYIPLGKLKDYFTHYDLHKGNVQLYKPVEDKYIQYHYHINPHKIISFKSSYMTKIIDYGRSYFDNNAEYFTHENADNMNSKIIYDTFLCSAEKCNKLVDVEAILVKDNIQSIVNVKKKNKCGYYSGFGWMEDLTVNPASKYYISTQTKNISHDLRALYDVLDFLKKYNPALLLQPEYSWLKKLVYTNKYGTRQEFDSGLPEKIVNVADAAAVLIDKIDNASFREKNNAAYAKKTKLGDLHVYMNMFPMDYDSVLAQNVFLKNKTII
jgi:hypothetical protein